MSEEWNTYDGWWIRGHVYHITEEPTNEYDVVIPMSVGMIGRPDNFFETKKAAWDAVVSMAENVCEQMRKDIALLSNVYISPKGIVHHLPESKRQELLDRSKRTLRFAEAVVRLRPVT